MAEQTNGQWPCHPMSAWSAGQHRSEHLTDLQSGFKTHGSRGTFVPTSHRDPRCLSARNIYGRPVTLSDENKQRAVASLSRCRPAIIYTAPRIIQVECVANLDKDSAELLNISQWPRSRHNTETRAYKSASTCCNPLPLSLSPSRRRILLLYGEFCRGPRGIRSHGI